MGSKKRQKHFDRFTAYDASVLGFVIRFGKEIDCSELLGGLSPDARKIADNAIDILYGRIPRHPDAERATREMMTWQEGKGYWSWSRHRQHK